MHPTLQTSPHKRRETPPLPNKLIDTRINLTLEAAKKEINAYLQSPSRTECEKILAKTMLDVIEGFSASVDTREIARRLDEFFLTVKDYEETQTQHKEGYESQISELSEELATSKRSRGMLPFTIEQLDAKISQLQRQRSEAVEIQEKAEDEWREAEKRFTQYRPGVGEGKARVAEIRRELQTAYETRNSNYREISKTVDDLKGKIDRLKAIKESTRILSTASLD